MNKVLKIFSITLLCCCIATLFTACNEKDEHSAITADYASLHNIDESSVSFKCYGEFGGTHVLLFNGCYNQALSNEVVDDVVFCHSQIITFTVYNNGSFCSLQEAFDNGLITHANLLTLRDNHMADNHYLYDYNERI
ncbi:MAG: hypothetical protein K2K60_02930 [Clostridia bacterium]|nr:hypothetical protein [Clostridia bacterium]